MLNGLKWLRIMTIIESVYEFLTMFNLRVPYTINYLWFEQHSLCFYLPVNSIWKECSAESFVNCFGVS